MFNLHTSGISDDEDVDGDVHVDVHVDARVSASGNLCPRQYTHRHLQRLIRLDMDAGYSPVYSGEMFHCHT